MTSITRDVLKEGMYHRLFQRHQHLLPDLKEIYELALAFYETRILTDEELIRNGAYFARIGERYTRHFYICVGDSLHLPSYSSSRLRSFFEKNQFRTGYATHGLFPYRGKFHPQMIKALINVIGLKPGETVLDPMMGSGTVLIEASLMQIKSIGIDASPFCAFMSKVKRDAMSMERSSLREARENYKTIFDLFSKAIGVPLDIKAREAASTIRCGTEIGEFVHALSAMNGSQELSRTVSDFLLLAYLDSVGYSERSNRRNPLENFGNILARYCFVVEKIQKAMEELDLLAVGSLCIQGDARSLPLSDNSVEGIIFSPPYSFAIDYLKNDEFHLRFLKSDMNVLRSRMVGLRGRSLKDKYSLYIEDMSLVLSECARVLKQNRYCVIIIGTNDNQLSKALGVSREKVKGLEKVMIELGAPFNLQIVRSLSRQISGMANTMRTEFIQIFQKG